MSRSAARWRGGLAVACLAAIALSGGTSPAAQLPPKPTLVTVNDFYFGPSAVTIKQGRAVKWVWSSLNTYPHDVHLKKGPKRLTNRVSYSTKTTAVTEARFQKTFKIPGTYKFICTIHPTQMKLTVTVRSTIAG